MSEENDLGISMVNNSIGFSDITPTENFPGLSEAFQSDENNTSPSHYNSGGLMSSLLYLDPESLCTSQCGSFFISIVNEWLDIRNHVIRLESRLEDALAQLPKPKCSYNQNSFEDKDFIRLPIENMEQFDKYCNLLTTSDDCRNRFNKILRHTICSKKNLKKNIAAVLKRFMTIGLASKFTTQRNKKDKRVLRETIFYQHLSEFFLNSELGNEPEISLSPATFLKAVGQVIMNCRDWNRNKRIRLEKNETIE